MSMLVKHVIRSGRCAFKIVIEFSGDLKKHTPSEINVEYSQTTMDTRKFLDKVLRSARVKNIKTIVEK